jgi:hypothetical protein
MVVRLAANQDTGDVAAGRAFIGDQSRVVLDRGDPYHLLHRGLAARARQDAFSCFPTRTRRIPSLERRTSFLVASACTLYDPNFCANGTRAQSGPSPAPGASPSIAPTLIPGQSVIPWLAAIMVEYAPAAVRLGQPPPNWLSAHRWPADIAHRRRCRAYGAEVLSSWLKHREVPGTRGPPRRNARRRGPKASACPR